MSKLKLYEPRGDAAIGDTIEVPHHEAIYLECHGVGQIIEADDGPLKRASRIKMPSQQEKRQLRGEPDES